MKAFDPLSHLLAHEFRPNPVVARYPRNECGRDFVVGDIHGMFEPMCRGLAELAFDPMVDRLFSVGDLVDRGPESATVLDWIGHPWFHACRGNHEQFAIDSVDPVLHDIWVENNGGGWWLGLDDSLRVRIRDAFVQLPLAIEVETATGVVGIVHADVPPYVTWSRFMALLDGGDRDATLYAMWSRNRIKGNGSQLPVGGGVERVYCGHTPTRNPVRVENVYYIDTGAVYAEEYADARLTIVQIHPQKHVEYAIWTAGLM